MDELARWLETNGFLRASTVRETGEYAQRGGIVDLYRAGLPAPIRLDFFGDTLESIRAFDPETQRTTGQLRALDLVPMSELRLVSDTMRRFRQAYTARFGGETRGDALYETISEGRRHPGAEHWLPLFYDKLDTLFDYFGDAPLLLDPLVDDAAGERLAQIADYYDARKSAYDLDLARSNYKPLEPRELYLTAEEWRDAARRAGAGALLALRAAPERRRRAGRHRLRRRAPGRDFAPERNEPEVNVFQAAADHVKALRGAGKSGHRRRLVGRLARAAWPCARRARPARSRRSSPSLPALALGKSARLAGRARRRAWLRDRRLAVIGEQDILGDRLVRRRRKTQARRKSARRDRRAVGGRSRRACRSRHRPLHRPGDDHRRRRAARLSRAALRRRRQALSAGRKHRASDALRLRGHGGRSSTSLGGAGWQSRKARMKNRIREMAKGLIAIAAQRMLQQAPKLVAPEGLYDEFCARFPYDETEDQRGAIDAVLDDLASGRPMDRLVCGDVGFGKTEVALRAAFCAAINGRQVAVVAPTTLLARQHYKNFAQRFAGLPIRIGRLSRMVGAAEARDTKKELGRGQRRYSRSAPTPCSARASPSRISASSSSTRSSISASATRSG